MLENHLWIQLSIDCRADPTWTVFPYCIEENQFSKSLLTQGCRPQMVLLDTPTLNFLLSLHYMPQPIRFLFCFDAFHIRWNNIQCLIHWERGTYSSTSSSSIFSSSWVSNIWHSNPSWPSSTSAEYGLSPVSPSNPFFGGVVMRRSSFPPLGGFSLGILARVLALLTDVFSVL